MLEIRLIPTRKKGFRVDVFRRYKSTDPTTQKAKLYYKQLGSFPVGSDDMPELLKQLEAEEIVQLQNWLAEIRFAESLHQPVDTLEKIALRLPPAFSAALTRLTLEAARAGLDFIPHQVILTHLLHQARRIQADIDQKNGFPSALLESAGLPDAPDTLEENNCASDPESSALFHALLNLDQPIGKTCTALEAVAAHYGKVKKIAPPQLKEWAGELKYRNPHKRIKKWCYAVAIEVLYQHGMNATHLMSPVRIADFWIRQNFSRYSVLEAPAVFIRKFEISEPYHAAVMEKIAHLYDILTTPTKKPVLMTE